MRFSTNDRVANATNMRLVRRVDDHVRWLKNRMSAFCHERLLELTRDPAAFRGYYKQFPSRYLNAWETQQVFHAIVDNYLNTFKRRIDNTHFKVQKRFVVERYRRNGKTFQKGEIKGGHTVWRQGTYSGLIKYLCYCPSPSQQTVAGTKIEEAVNAVARTRPDHWARIQRIVRNRQARILARIPLLEYHNGAHWRHVRESRSCVLWDSTNRRYQCFYRYRAGTGKNAEIVHLPLLTHTARHKARRLHLDGNHLVYLKRGKFHVAVTQTGEAPVMAPQGRVVGADVNCKHNLMVFSHGLKIDYDRRYLASLVDELQALDAKGQQATRADRKRLGTLVRRNEWYWQHVVHDVLDALQADGVTDIVLENLHQFPATFIKHDALAIKYSRLVRLLRLSDLKHYFRRQALKRGMRVHFTPPHYSSQQCRGCGHISRGNRKTQEQFQCEACGREANADEQAALNLEARLTSDVPRSRLHEVDRYGRLSPQEGLNRYRIRRVLEQSEGTPREVLPVPLAWRAITPMADFQPKSPLCGSAHQTR
ncbi:MAG TPA: transposase [Gammaproteobacteria bacterium]|nr:transposase [Gammaproteobacteria bacterium]